MELDYSRQATVSVLYEKETVEDYFKRFKLLQCSLGYKLFVSDFDKIYPDATERHKRDPKFCER